MKKILFIILLSIISINVKAVTLPVEVKADSAILINLDENEVIYEKNPDKVQILASLTKIMTAYTALQHIDNLNEKITITEKDIRGLEGFTIAEMPIGSKVTYKDLLYATILLSAADASQALANHIAGSTEKFVEMMNEEADKLSLRNAMFKDTYGGHDDNKATAREISTLLKEALKNETFNEIFKTTYHTMLNGIRVVNYTRSIATFHGLDDTLITGNKSGYTPEAGLLLASTATINNTNYALVVMNSEPNPYMSTHIIDTYNIYHYVQNNNYEKRLLLEEGTLLKKLKVINGLVPEYNLYLDESITKTLSDEDYKNITIDYNIVEKLDSSNKKGDNIGFIDILVNNEVIATQNIYLKEKLFQEKQTESAKEKKNYIPIIIMSLGFIIVVIISSCLFFKKTKTKQKNK